MGWLSPLFRIISVIFGFVGFGFGFTIGLVAGYYFFFFSEPLDVKVYSFLGFPCFIAEFVASSVWAFVFWVIFHCQWLHFEILSG